eukprot:3657260-Rhodomonas_salina.1
MDPAMIKMFSKQGLSLAPDSAEAFVSAFQKSCSVPFVFPAAALQAATANACADAAELAASARRTEQARRRTEREQRCFDMDMADSSASNCFTGSPAQLVHSTSLSITG